MDALSFGADPIARPATPAGSRGWRVGSDDPHSGFAAAEVISPRAH